MFSCLLFRSKKAFSITSASNPGHLLTAPILRVSCSTDLYLFQGLVTATHVTGKGEWTYKYIEKAGQGIEPRNHETQVRSSTNKIFGPITTVPVAFTSTIL